MSGPYCCKCGEDAWFPEACDGCCRTLCELCRDEDGYCRGGCPETR